VTARKKKDEPKAERTKKKMSKTGGQSRQKQEQEQERRPAILAFSSSLKTPALCAPRWSLLAHPRSGCSPAM
jgi:hypothetical protein